MAGPSRRPVSGSESASRADRTRLREVPYRTQHRCRRSAASETGTPPQAPPPARWCRSRPCTRGGASATVPPRDSPGPAESVRKALAGACSPQHPRHRVAERPIWWFTRGNSVDPLGWLSVLCAPQQRAAFELVEATPDAVVLPDIHGPVQAGFSDLALSAHLLRHSGLHCRACGRADRKEQFRVLVQARR